jgi:hypothetical protein
MVAYIHVQANLVQTAGVPEYTVVNNWYAQTTDLSGGLYTGAQSFLVALNAFYGSIGGYINADVSRTQSIYKVYDMALPKPNPPVIESPMTFSNMTAGRYYAPPEVALVGSFFSGMPSGSIPARRRGRVYIGPLAYTGSEHLHRPPTPIRTVLSSALNTLLLSSGSATDWTWSTFSRADAGGWFKPPSTNPPDFAKGMHNVVGGWVDNEWDTQRRRGLNSDARSNFGAAVTSVRLSLNVREELLPKRAEELQETHNPELDQAPSVTVPGP